MATKLDTPQPDENNGAEQHKRQLNRLEKEALHLGVHAAAKAAEHAAKHSNQKIIDSDDIKDLERLGHGAIDRDFYRNELNNLKNPSWYKRTAVNAAKVGLKASTSKLKKAILITLVINLAAAGILFLLATLGPLKYIHFEQIMRSINYARFQLVINRFASKVVFQAAVLTPDSEGTFRKSPLVRQILLATPDRQIKQLGQRGKLQFEFYENHSFGSGLLPFSESLKAVVIDTGNGTKERISIDDIARERFNAPYKDLTLQRKWAIESEFVSRVQFTLGDTLRLMPRYVRLNPMYQIRQRVGMKLYRWLDSARTYSGKTEEQARSQLVEDTKDRNLGPKEERARSSNPEIQGDAEYREEQETTSAKTGKPPGEKRNTMAKRMKLLGGISDAVFATTSVCVIHDLANSFEEYQDEREAMAMRAAGLVHSTADQYKSGDVTAEAVGAANSLRDGNGETPGAADSYIYRKVTGQSPPSDREVERQAAAVPWLKPVSIFAQSITVADEVLTGGGILSIIDPKADQTVKNEICGAVLSPEFQYTTAAAELVITIYSLGTVKGATAGLKALINIGLHSAVGYGANELLNKLIEKAIEEYSYMAFSGILQGADGFNADWVADKSLAEASNRILYGAPLTHEQANEAQEGAIMALKAANQQKSLRERYFAIDNPFSLLGLAVAKIPSNSGDIGSALRSGASFLGSILSSPFRLIGSLTGKGLPLGVAHAADTSFLDTNFGVDEWGWSIAELNRIENDESFSLEPLVKRVEPRLTELNERYAKCYDFSTFVLQSERPEEGCSREDLTSDDALYWRYYNALMFSATTLTGDV